MDSKAYIESGAIEACLMGLASPEERAELEQLRLKDPAINEAIIRFENELEARLTTETMPVPADVKDNLLKKLQPEFSKAPVVTMRRSRPAWKWMAAASIVLLVASAGYIFYLKNQNSNMQEEYASMLAETNDLKVQNEIVSAQLKEMQKGMSMLSDPTVAKVTMPGMGSHTLNKAMLLWDTRTKDVYVMPMDMPETPKGMQFQLWAFVDGEPVDAGMMGNCSVVCTMKNIPKAEAFAITLEKEGGSSKPDMENVYVMGKINP
jgi:anti-sigma-K factor RskA